MTMPPSNTAYTPIICIAVILPYPVPELDQKDMLVKMGKRGFFQLCEVEARDRLQIFISNSYGEFVALYDIDKIFYKRHMN